jgi:hypothetical protein
MGNGARAVPHRPYLLHAGEGREECDPAGRLFCHLQVILVDPKSAPAITSLQCNHAHDHPPTNVRKHGYAQDLGKEHLVKRSEGNVRYR